MTLLNKILITIALAAVTTTLLITYTRQAHAARNCHVSIFPVAIEEGNQCRFGEVAVGFDHVEGKIACGRISVNCN